MCQIIAIKTTTKKLKKIIKDEELSIEIQSALERKGGDFYNAEILFQNDLYRVSYNKTEGTTYNIIHKINAAFMEIPRIKKMISKKTYNIGILLFSRQQPEMETTSSIEQPYTTDISKVRTFAVHGTIHNDKEISKKYGLVINIDTEVFKELSLVNWKEAKGTFAIIGLDSSNKKIPSIFTKESGLKIWNKPIIQKNKYLGDMASTDPLLFLDNNTEMDTPCDTGHRTLYASFSAGMDIALSTFKELSTGKYNRVVLNYFAWGSQAEVMETLQLKKFKKLYEYYFPGIIIETHIVEATGYFDNFFEISMAPPPKISYQNADRSTGNNQETESPLAYVPYRNTQFALILASQAEALDLKNVSFLFGLNLSEGMVFMDNSEGWLKTVKTVINLGGKDSDIVGTYDVVSPYVTRTKTNMLAEFYEEFGLDVLEELLELAVSCYYPDEKDRPCQKCGSCLLREKAMQNLIANQ